MSIVVVVVDVTMIGQYIIQRLLDDFDFEMAARIGRLGRRLMTEYRRRTRCTLARMVKSLTSYDDDDDDEDALSAEWRTKLSRGRQPHHVMTYCNLALRHGHRTVTAMRTVKKAASGAPLATTCTEIRSIDVAQTLLTCALTRTPALPSELFSEKSSSCSNVLENDVDAALATLVYACGWFLFGARRRVGSALDDNGGYMPNFVDASVAYRHLVERGLTLLAGDERLDSTTPPLRNAETYTLLLYLHGTEAQVVPPSPFFARVSCERWRHTLVNVRDYCVLDWLLQQTGADWFYLNAQHRGLPFALSVRRWPLRIVASNRYMLCTIHVLPGGQQCIVRWNEVVFSLESLPSVDPVLYGCLGTTRSRLIRALADARVTISPQARRPVPLKRPITERGA